MLPRTVRARATAAASLVVALALAVGAFGLPAVLEASLRDGLDRTLGDRARDLATVAPGLAPGTELDTAGDEDIALVVGADGRVVAASSDEFSAASPPFTLFLTGSGESEDEDDPTCAPSAATTTTVRPRRSASPHRPRRTADARCTWRATWTASRNRWAPYASPSWPASRRCWSS